MSYPPRLQLLFLGLFFLAAGGQVQAEENEAAIQERLQAINRKVAALRQALNTAGREEKKLLDELQAQDKRINDQHQKIRAQQARLQEIQDKIVSVSSRIDRHNQHIHAQKREMAELIKLALYTGHDLGLKRLLLTDSSRRADLAGHQIRYLQHRLYRLVQDIAERLRELETLRRSLQSERESLKQGQAKLQAQQAELQEQRRQRRFVLQALRDKIRADETELRQLDRDRQRLNRLLTELKNLLDDLPDDLGKEARFARLKGRLSWPVAGKVLHRYGSARGRERHRWEGLVFAATAGAPVKSVAYGRVAFADWLRGYGLLVVLDHGDGYMTLYGHNEALLVETGDWVQAGKVIALVGNSGSLGEPALYFELRKDARPINPAPWLARR